MKKFFSSPTVFDRKFAKSWKRHRCFTNFVLQVLKITQVMDVATLTERLYRPWHARRSFIWCWLLMTLFYKKKNEHAKFDTFWCWLLNWKNKKYNRTVIFKLKTRYPISILTKKTDLHKNLFLRFAICV